MLELKDATLTIGGQQLFGNLSFMAQDGHITCVTGPAGSGKTLLLQALLGLLALDEGLVSIDGELLTPLSAPTFRRMMAYVPQKVNAKPNDNDNVNMAGLETVWSPYNSGRYQLTPIEEPLNLAPIASKAVIIADDPDDTTWDTLRKLAAAGRAVVAATNREDFLHQSDKIITLGKHDTVVS